MEHTGIDWAKQRIPSNAESLVKEFIRQIRVERGLSLNTQATYGYQLASYLKFLHAHGKAPSDAARDDVFGYLESLHTRQLRPASIFMAAICIRQFHRFLKAGGHAPGEAPELKLPKVGERLPNPLSPGELERLLAVPVGNRFHRLRMKAGLECLYSAGLRVSELITLKLGQVNLTEGWIRVVGKGDRERIVPIGPKATEALILYLEARKFNPGAGSNILFLTSRGYAWTRGAFWLQMKQLAKDAGVVGRVHPHRVRHAFGAILTARGVPLRAIQENLGHRQVSTTQIYTRITVDQIRAALTAAHPRF